MHTLNRLIESDGVTYYPGTPLSELPPRIRDSVASVGWVSETDLPSPPAPRGKGAVGEGASDAASPVSGPSPDGVPDPAPAADPAPAPKPKRSRAKPAN